MSEQSLDTTNEMVKTIKEDLLPDLKADIGGINNRLDTLNGKVAKHEAYIVGHKAMLSTVVKLLGVLGFFGTIIATLLSNSIHL